jgi:hypothetical protein
MNKHTLLFWLLASSGLLLALCSLGLPVGAAPPVTTITYAPTDALFANPERGFHTHSQTYSGNYVPLDLDTLRGYRQNEAITLVLRMFYLEDFVDADISQAYLDKMQADFDTVRAAGMKMVVRFAYTDALHYAPGTTWPPIPPYGDATKERILRHIEQLRPILQANSDVIAVVQAGFIGVWGEWFYTDHFVHDPSNPDDVSEEDYANRKEVLYALLAALPSDRMTQVRTPRYKERIVPESKNYTPITREQAYKGTPIASVGHHNDCFLASDSDYGTYLTPTIERPYLASETLYLPMGGETCAVNPPRSECPTALEELAYFHWSFLNIGYQPEVIAGWASGGCLDTIRRRLGYRFALVEGAYGDEVKPGGAFTSEIKLRNDGWAAPFNPRRVELWLRPKVGNVNYRATLPDDPRFWLAGDSLTYSLAYTLCIRTDMPPGDYEMLLRLPDPESRLYGRPEYSIRLANEGVWEAGTGFNNLLHTVTVTETVEGSSCDGALMLEPAFRLHLPVILRRSLGLRFGPRSESQPALTLPLSLRARRGKLVVRSLSYNHNE